MKYNFEFVIHILVLTVIAGCSMLSKNVNAYIPFSSGDKGKVFLYSNVPFEFKVPSIPLNKHLVTVEYMKCLLPDSNRENNLDSVSFSDVWVDTLAIEDGFVRFIPRTDGELIFKEKKSGSTLLVFKFRVVEPPIIVWHDKIVRSPSGHILNNVLDCQGDTIRFSASIVNMGYVNYLTVENIRLVVNNGMKLQQFNIKGNILDKEALMLLRGLPSYSIVLLSFKFRGFSDVFFELNDNIYFTY